MKHREHDDHVALNGEVDGVRETPQQSAADPGAEILIRKRAIDYPVVGAPELGEELLAQPDFLVLVPVECSRDVEISTRLGSEPMLGY